MAEGIALAGLPTNVGLVAEDLVAGYGAGPVLRGVSLRVEPGEVVGLLGPNGSGKTTLVRVASRALRPERGRVLVGGVDPYDTTGREAARHLAVVPQDLHPAFSFTALEAVLMGRAPYLSPWGSGEANDWQAARDAMAATGVQHLADRSLEELSGGERRRVILAQALAQDAPVLLLDEPTTHLDLRHVLEVLEIVRDLAERRGAAVLAILHDLNLASTTCDRIVVFHRGEVVAEGRPEAVVTESLLRDVYEVDAHVDPDGFAGRPTVSLAPPRSAPVPLERRVHVIGGAGRAASIVRRLSELGWEVTIGVLHATDTDAATAERLNLRRVVVPPFSGIDPASAREAEALCTEAELVVVCDAPYGPGNLANLEIALRAARAGVRVVLVGAVPIEERDFTRGRARALWSALAGMGEVVGDPDLVPAALEGGRGVSPES